MKKYVGILVLFVLLFFCGCVNKNAIPRNISNGTIHENKMMGIIKNNLQSRQQETKSFVYLIYSSTCPHCHHLIEYLDSMNTSIKIIKLTNPGKLIGFLKNHDIKWDGGVPLLVAQLENGTVIAIEGYPAASQDKNGYFLGKDFEEKLCKRNGGKAIYSGSTYLYCILPGNIIMGNKYSVDMLISTCKKYGCKKIL